MRGLLEEPTDEALPPLAPGGISGSVQTNNGSGGFYGDANFVYNGTSVGIGNGVTPVETLTVKGTVSITDASTSFKALFDTTLLSSDQIYAFPDRSGTFALLSDIPAAATGTFWGQSWTSGGTVTGSLTSVGNITGGASSMIITAGTGASRTLTLQTTTAGSVATDAITINNLQSATLPEQLGTEISPAMTGATGVNWTFGAGYTTPLASTIDKTADGTNTATPVTQTITVGVTYKVVMTTSAFTVGSFYYSLGGVVGTSFSTAKTVTNYITATTTGKMIITPTNTSRFTISAISVKALVVNASGLNVFGQSTFYSTMTLRMQKVVMNGGTAIGQSNNQAQDNTANWFFGGAGGTLAHVTGFNLGIGSGSLANAGAGAANVGIGFSCLSGTLTGNDNLCFGAFAGRDCTTGNNNTYYGSSAGILIQEGTRNVGFGREALTSNRRGHYNTGIGYQAMALLVGDGVSDDKNVAIGAFSGYSLTTGKNNVILGAGTNSSGTTGSPGITTGTGNTVLGAGVTNLGNPTNNIVIAIGTGAIKLQYDATNWLVTSTAFNPSASDGVALGTTTLMWSDLFLASGAVINFNNGDVTLTHSSDKLSLAGGTLSLDNKISTYNNINTAGWGSTAIYGAGRATGQTAANASVSTYTVGAADGTFEVSANVLVTTSSAENFTVTVTYTDEGNTARTLTLNFQILAGTIGTAIAFANGAVPYEGIPLHIRVKASTAITVKTVGTFTGCTYNVEGIIKQTA